MEVWRGEGRVRDGGTTVINAVDVLLGRGNDLWTELCHSHW